MHPWVTRHGAEPLPPEDDNCCVLIEVTEEEVENSVKHIPSLATVVSSGGTRRSPVFLSYLRHSCLYMKNWTEIRD